MKPSSLILEYIYIYIINTSILTNNKVNKICVLEMNQKESVFVVVVCCYFYFKPMSRGNSSS